MNIFREELDPEKYILVRYFLESKKTLRDAAWNLAIGQSVGNPNIRNRWETDELFENHACMVIGNEKKLSQSRSGEVTIGFPLLNIDLATDGISHLLCQIMGGQLDIDVVLKCHVLNVKFPPEAHSCFKGPKFGISGIRKFTGVYNKPLLGGIVKPKIGIDSNTLLEMVKEMVEGGINFIKEDEIMSNPTICPLEERVPLVMDYLKGKNVIYSVCINADPPFLLDRVKQVYELGGNSVHVNFWSGLGAYKAIRDMDLPLFIHFQKSGDKILTNQNHDYHISWKVICDLAGLMGVDFIHAGMWGGYMNNNEEDLEEVLSTLHSRNVLPALSCGMHPGLVKAINNKFGIDYMANVGGALHGHPRGSFSGTKAMRQAIDGTGGTEYDEAIEKWGLIE
jgi:ribulose-bisphosphate carboxylase large chain